MEINELSKAQGACVEDPRRVATADHEAWVQCRLMTAMKMALALHREQQVRADEHSKEYGLRGIAEGAAREIIETLGMRPEFINIRRFDNINQVAMAPGPVRGQL